MIELFIIAVVAGAVASLLVSIRAGDRSLEVLSKVVASGGFVVLGLSRWSAGDGVGTWIVVGLLLCAAGDLLLVGSRTFDPGLFSFLMGHVAYVVAFSVALPITNWPPLFMAPIALASLGAGSWLWPHLGRRRIPVAAYIAAISVMVWGGLAAAAAGVMPWTVAVGAVLFFLSDLAVARHRFVKAEFLNRGIGLPLYYAGQVLIALAI